MTLEELFKQNNLSLNYGIPKGLSLKQLHQAVETKLFTDQTNNLIKKYNTINATDYSKYGDYSSNTKQYEYITSNANDLLKQLEGFKGLISDDEYKKFSDTLSSIATNSDTQKKTLQGIIDFYSSFEDEKRYKEWETDNRLYAENGDLTAEQVEYFITSMEKRKAKGELNGYEQEFYNWIKNYDLTRGYKDEEYYNQRIANLQEEADKLVQHRFELIDKRSSEGREEIEQRLSDIDGRIGDMKLLRNKLDKENVYEDKGYSLIKGAIGFEDKATKYEKSVDINPFPKRGYVISLNSLKNVEDAVVFAYNNKPYYEGGKYGVNVPINGIEASFIEGSKPLLGKADGALGKIISWEKYTFLEEDEYKTYCFLASQDKEHGTKSAEKFISDMEPTLDMRMTTDRNKKIKEAMNAEGFKGDFATVWYNVLSIPASVLGGVQALPSAATSLIKGEDINIYSESFELSNFASTVRATTDEMIDSPGWSLVYNAAMSTADSLLAAVVFRGAAPYILAASAATSRMKELVLQGASDADIVIGSLASGVIEVVTEKISIERLFNGNIKPTTFKQFLAEGLTQAAFEGSEEIASEVLNNLSDEIFRGSMSDYNQAIRRYEAEGLSKSEATKKAANDVLVQIMEALLSGMISGGIGGYVAGGSQMHKFNVIGTNIIKGNNVDTVLTAAEYLGTLNPEIKGQVEALKNYNKTGKSGKNNAVYKRTLGKIAATVAENTTEVKQSVTEKAVTNELKNRGIDPKTIGKVSKIVSKFLSGQKLSSSEQGYLQHNSVAATVMQEIEAAQEQIKSQALASSPATVTPTTGVQGGISSTSQSSAPQWAVDLVNKLTTIDSAAKIVNLSVSGKSTENTGNSEVNRMIKILSIASGKTTAEQEAEAGDIPYSQYIREKEAAAKKENTAENSGEVENTETKIMNSFGITKLNDTLHIQKKVLETLEHEGFWENEEEHSTTVINNDSKMDIVINESGIEETFSYKHFTKLPKDIKIKKLITVRKLPQIIQKGILVSDNVENYHDKKSSVKYAYIECTVEIDGELSVVTVAIRKSAQKNKFWVHQIDIKQDDGSTPAGTSESSKTGYPTSANTVIISSDEFIVNKNVTDNINSEDDFDGFTEVDVSEDGVTYESRLLHTMRGEKITTKGQAYIKKICQNLGIEVVFENVYTPKGKHADGYIDNDGVIHIDYHCSNPVEFVLKHELTHYGESSALYSNFCKAVISSEAFAQWINGKVEGDGNVTLKAAEYREQISRLYEKNGVKLSPAKQQSEMIANFVGEVLFSAESNGLERLTTNMTVKEKRSVIDFIKDFIAHIKDKLTKVKGVSSEILSLERKFNKLISTAEQNKTADEGATYSIAEDDSGYYVKIDTSQELFDGKSLQEQQDIAKKIIKANFKGKVLKVGADGNAYINKNSAEEYAYPANRRMDAAVKQNKMRAAPELDNLLAVSQFIENQSDDGRHPEATGGWDTYLTRFQISGVMFKGEVKIKVTDRGYVFYDITQIEELPVNGGQTVLNTAAASGSPSTDIIDDNSSSVNSNSMQDIKKHSIDLEENVSENEEKTTPESFSIPTDTETGFSIKQQLENSRDELNSMKVVASYDTTKTFEYNQQVVDWVMEIYEGIDYKVSRNGFGDIILDKKRIKSGVSYTKSYAEKIAFGLIPDVLQKGIEIGVHTNHKNRLYDTVTFAAPVELNGVRGNMAVVVRQTGKNYYKAHRIVMPDGTQMLLDEKRDTAETAGGVENNSGLSPTDNVSTDIISQNTEEVNNTNKYSIDMETSEEADITEIPDLMAVIADRYKRGELSEEEYRVEVQGLLMRANEKYGTIEPGEKAENKTSIPKRVTSNKSEKTKRWVRTVHESGILPEDMEVELEAKILKDAMSYQIIEDKAAQRQANLAIERGTAVKEWEAAVNGDGRVGKREIAIGETLLKLAAERKDNRAVMKLIAEVSEMGTRAGQIVQAMSMLKRMDGIGQLYYVQKSVERINRDLDKRFARKVKKGKLDRIPQVKINETLANQLAASKTQQDFEVTYEAMLQSIAEQVPSTFLDKWNAWRYFAMLFNPRTHIRNIFGNFGFLPTIRFKDLLAASMEKIFLGEEQRTKSVVVKKEYQKFAEEDYSEIEAIITGGGKMNPSDEIRDRQNVFDTKWLEKLRKWNFDKLEKEDAYFLKKHYAHALGGFLQARNVDITKEIDSAVMEEARKYAMVEAQKATYRDASKAAEVISNFTSKGGILGNFVEGVLPFKKTPINIVKRGIEYSPIGLIKTLTKGTVDLVNEKITASQYIDGIAGGLTGTGIVLLGMLLSSLGFIKITGGFDDDEEDDINRLLGRQEYAVEIFGHSYTIDWMAPACIPFFMGVEIQKAMEEDGNGNIWNSVKNVGSNALEPIINLSMLSGMQDIISSAKYSEGSAVVGSVLWNILLSYGSQALPSIGGSVARTIDGTRRTTYIDKTSWLSDMGQMAIGKLESKVPFASMLRSEYVDEFGRTEDGGNVFVRAIQNFVSPGYYSKIEDDPVIEQLKELYDETGESVLPSKPKKYIDVGGEKKHLTADEYEEYAKEVGQERYEYLEEFFGSSNVKNLAAEEKRQVISNLYSYAQAKAKTQYSKYKLPDLYAKVYEAEKDGLSPVDYYASKIATNVENADTNGSGTVTKNERLAAIRKMNVSNDIKAALIALYS